MIPLPCRGKSHSATCSPDTAEVGGVTAAARTWSAPWSPCAPRTRDSVSDQEERSWQSLTRPRGSAPGSPPRSPACVRQFSAGPGAIWRDASLDRAHQPATPSVSQSKSPAAPELEGPRKKSHAGKLQQLKERIRKQRQRHRALTQEHEQPSAVYAGDLLHGRPLKRKVRKVAAAPAAPVYRGQ